MTWIESAENGIGRSLDGGGRSRASRVPPSTQLAWINIAWRTVVVPAGRRSLCSSPPPAAIGIDSTGLEGCGIGLIGGSGDSGGGKATGVAGAVFGALSGGSGRSSGVGLAGTLGCCWGRTSGGLDGSTGGIGRSGFASASSARRSGSGGCSSIGTENAVGITYIGSASKGGGSSTG